MKERWEGRTEGGREGGNEVWVQRCVLVYGRVVTYWDKNIHCMFLWKAFKLLWRMCTAYIIYIKILFINIPAFKGMYPNAGYIPPFIFLSLAQKICMLLFTRIYIITLTRTTLEQVIDAFSLLWIMRQFSFRSIIWRIEDSRRHYCRNLYNNSNMSLIAIWPLKGALGPSPTGPGAGLVQ